MPESITVTDVCVAKVGKPFQMRECGAPVVYLTAGEAKERRRGTYEGWYHYVGNDHGHNGVPRRMIR